MSLNLSLPIGARATAAIYSAVALSDQDLFDDAVDLLVEQERRLAREAQTPSELLAYCAILQQLVLRYYDLGDRDRAIETARLAQQSSPSLNDPSYEEFPTSPGISWSSKRVQRDVVRALRAAAIAAEATLEEARRRQMGRIGPQPERVGGIPKFECATFPRRSPGSR